MKKATQMKAVTLTDDYGCKLNEESTIGKLSRDLLFSNDYSLYPIIFRNTLDFLSISNYVIY